MRLGIVKDFDSIFSVDSKLCRFPVFTNQLFGM